MNKTTNTPKTPAKDPLKDRSKQMCINIPKCLADWLKANCGGLGQPTQTDFVIVAVAEKIEAEDKKVEKGGW